MLEAYIEPADKHTGDKVKKYDSKVEVVASVFIARLRQIRAHNLEHKETEGFSSMRGGFPVMMEK